MEFRIPVSIKKKYEKEEKRIKKPKAITYPTKLNREDYFKCPIWFADEPKFVDNLNNASDSYIDKARKNFCYNQK